MISDQQLVTPTQGSHFTPLSYQSFRPELDGQTYSSLHNNDRKNPILGNSPEVVIQSNGKDSDTEIVEELPWRPPYLRRRILACFLAIFVLLLVAIELLYFISNRNYGLATALSNQHYLWTYGPTALLTILAVLWARVEYQSKLIAPWLRLAQEPALSPSRTLLLDYISDFQLFVLFKSASNHDSAVALTSAVGLLIKALIVISTGLITLSWIPVTEESHPATVTDAFVGDIVNLQGPIQGGPDGLYVVAGLQEGILDYPDGLTDTFAFQSVDNNLPSDAFTRTRVKGFTTTSGCTPAEITICQPVPYWNTTLDKEGQWGFMINFTSPLCTGQFFIMRPQLQLSQDTNTYSMGYISAIACNATGIDYSGGSVPPFFAMLAEFTFPDGNVSSTDPDYNISNWSLNRSAQAICMPTARLVDVDVVRNGTQSIEVMVSPGSTETVLTTVTTNRILDVVFVGWGGSNSLVVHTPTGDPWSHETQPYNYSGTHVNADIIMSRALDWRRYLSRETLDLYSFDTLNNTVSEYHSQVAAIVAKLHLMETASNQTSSFVTYNQQRLVVRNWSVQWMAGILACCIFLIIATVFVVPRRGILPCRPTTTLAMASVLKQSDDLLFLLHDSGATDEKTLARFSRPYEFQAGSIRHAGSSGSHLTVMASHMSKAAQISSFPQVWPKPHRLGLLSPGGRLVTCTVFIGLILTFELVLRKSESENGLGDTHSDEYIHYLWTTGPSIVLGSLAMLLSSFEFSVISLAPFLALQTPISLDKFRRLELLDMTTLHRIVREVKTVNFLSLTSTLAVLIASLFTIFSSSLFQPLPVVIHTPVLLHVNQSFSTLWSNTSVQGHGAQLSSLILSNNLKYPRFSYMDLAFPELSAHPLREDQSVNGSAASIHSVIPAIRSRLSCRYYDSSAITVKRARSHLLGGSNITETIIIEDERCGWSPDVRFIYNQQFDVSDEDATSFGMGGPTGAGARVPACSELLFIWGLVNHTNIQHIASMGCNVTMETVDVEVNFLNTDLDFDLEKPPVPIESSVSDSGIPTEYLGSGSVNQTIFWDVYGSLGTPGRYNMGLDETFNALTRSPWGVTYGDLGDPGATKKVQEAIKLQHGILTAQLLASARIPANTTSVLARHLGSNTTSILVDQLGSNGTDAQPQFAGNLTMPNAYLRVVQDAVSTRILEVLLGLALLLFLVNWAMMPDTSWLPARSPTTIGGIAALVAGGNLADVLPPESASLDERGLEAAFGPGYTFRMGWGHAPDVDNLNINENGESRYGIWAMREDEGKD